MNDWKTIEQFPDYEISKSGDVRRKFGGQGAVAGKVLKKHFATSTGYPDFRLRANGKCFSVSIHTLVAKAFLGPRPEGMQIRHLDGNKLNCHANNLAYGTALENAKDKIFHGRSSRGAKNPKSKLNEKQVMEILERKKSGESAKNLSVVFDVSESCIYRIANGFYWSHTTQASNRNTVKVTL